MDDHETMARHRDVGAACHRIIATLAAATANPTLEQTQREIRRHLRHLGENEGRAHRQNLAGLVNTYFRELAPQAPWQFFGAEVHLGNGRVDLLWKSPDGRMLLDELKTGHWAFFGTQDHHRQGRRYLQAGRALHGSHVVGLRLLCLTRPKRSLYLTDPDAQFVPLLAQPELPAPAQRPRLGQAATLELMAAGRPRHQQLTLPQMGEVA